MRAGYGTIEYGIAPYAMGRGRRWADTLTVDRVCTPARAGDLISKSALLKILGIDFNAGAGMFSLVAFIELVPRGELTSKDSSWGNHEPQHAWLLARGTRKKKTPSKPNELLSSRFSLSMYGPDSHRVCTLSLICGRPSGACLVTVMVG